MYELLKVVGSIHGKDIEYTIMIDISKPTIL